jgi:hypothetical protein
MRETRTTVKLIHNVLMNPNEVNENGWDVAKYEFSTVGITEFKLNSNFNVDHVLESVYRNSQNITGSWVTNEGYWNKSVEARSTMIGDRIQVGDDLYEVSAFGFKKLDS